MCRKCAWIDSTGPSSAASTSACPKRRTRFRVRSRARSASHNRTGAGVSGKLPRRLPCAEHPSRGFVEILRQVVHGRADLGVDRMGEPVRRAPQRHDHELDPAAFQGDDLLRDERLREARIALHDHRDRAAHGEGSARDAAGGARGRANACRANRASARRDGGCCRDLRADPARPVGRTRLRLQFHATPRPSCLGRGRARRSASGPVRAARHATARMVCSSRGRRRGTITAGLSKVRILAERVVPAHRDHPRRAGHQVFEPRVEGDRLDPLQPCDAHAELLPAPRPP